MPKSDPYVISWDIRENELSDRSSVFDVVGASDDCRVTFNCDSEAAAERLVAALNDIGVVCASAESLR